MDRTALAAAYQHRLKAVLWGGPGRYNSYAKANPGEAAKIDAYVAAIVAGQTPTPPTLATEFGQMVVGLIAAGMGGPPPPPPSTTGTRGVGALLWGGAVGFSTDEMAKLDKLGLDLGGDLDIAHKVGGVPAYLYRSALTCKTSWDSCMDYTTAQANGWLLPIENVSFKPNNIIDLFNPEVGPYLGQHWADLCRQYGFKGCFADDVVLWCTALCNALPPGKTQDEWHAALVAHVARIGAVLKANGLAFVPNASGYIPRDANTDNGVNTYNFWAELAGSVSGLSCEYWEQNPVDNTVRKAGSAYWYDFWDEWRRLHQLCNERAIGFYPGCYFAPDDPTCTYLRASFYLDFKPGSGSALMINPLTKSVYGPVWCKDPGAPLGDAYNSAGIWIRRFEAETITVDPRR